MEMPKWSEENVHGIVGDYYFVVHGQNTLRPACGIWHIDGYSLIN